MHDSPNSDPHRTNTTRTRTEASPAPTSPPIASARSLGRYQILSVVGEGGMGQVYAAYDPKLDRRVALKLLRTVGVATHRHRLNREARALARLSHPNVVTVHEVDEHDGRLLVAMEYVQGQTLKDWMAANPPQGGTTWLAEALELLLQAGQGLAAAHEAQLVHRDFKPANVLVGTDGRVRVADFGLARSVFDDNTLEEPSGSPSTGPHSLAAEDATRTGVVVGTPAYMAPEQADGKPLDGRSDQYSFCLVSWELLFGVRPRRGALTRPQKSAIPEGVEKVLRRGLAKRPSARFREMKDLLAALSAQLGALRGRPPSSLRRRGLWVVTTAALLGGGLWGVQKWTTARRVRACETQGDSIDALWNEDSRTAVVDALEGTKLGTAIPIAESVTPWLDERAESWREQATAACLNTQVENIWTQSESDAASWCLEHDWFDLQTLLEELSVADETVAQNATQAAATFSPPGHCLTPEALRAPIPQRGIFQRFDFYETLRAQSKISTLVATGKYDAALAVAETALRDAEALGWLPLTASVRVHYAQVLDKLGRGPDVASAAEEAFVEASRSGAWAVAADAAIVSADAMDWKRSEGRIWLMVAEAASFHAGDPLDLREAERSSVEARAYARDGQHDAALRLHRKALEIYETALGSRSFDAATAHDETGQVLLAQGSYKDALDHMNRSIDIKKTLLGESHPSAARTLGNIGATYAEFGNVESGIKIITEALRIQVETLGENHIITLGTRANLGATYFNAGNIDRAISILEDVVELVSKHHKGHPRLVSHLNALATSYYVIGRFEEATPLFEKALAIADTVDINSSTLSILHINAGNLHDENNNYELAMQHLTQGLSIARKTVGEDHVDTAHAYNALARVASRNGDHKRALDSFEKALNILERAIGPSTSQVAWVLFNMGEAHRANADPEGAFEAWRRSHEIRIEVLGPEHHRTKTSLDMIGSLCEEERYAPACKYRRSHVGDPP